MVYIECNDKTLEYPGSFDLIKTLTSGQNSRWAFQTNYASDGWYSCIKNHLDSKGVSKDYPLPIRVLGNGWYKVPVRADHFITHWESYFDLSLDYDVIFQQVNDPFLKTCFEFGKGLKILKQSLWETTLTFILSQQSNIPKINTMRDLLVEHCSFTKTFPSPLEVRARSERYIQEFVRCGYRARYLIAAAQAFLDDDLLGIDYVSYEVQKLKLKQITGIGPKVADCIILFGLHNTEAFPIDVWMKRIIAKEYPGGVPKSISKSKYAGIYQQYMFYYALFNKKLYT